MQETTTRNAAKFRGEILQKIYRIWLIRRLLPVLAGEVILLALVLYLIGRMVFVQRVIENALNVLFLHPPQIIGFLTTMFAKAPLLTKILRVAIIVLLALILRHLTQGILRLILIKGNYFSRVKTADEVRID